MTEKPDGILTSHNTLLRMTEKPDEILPSSGKGTELLRMTEWVDEIVISPNQRTVGHLAMTDIDRYFHCHLVPQMQHNYLLYFIK
jgi:hypothetical protein